MDKAQRFREKMLSLGFEEDRIKSFIQQKMTQGSSGVSNVLGDIGDLGGSVLSQSGPVTQAFGNYNPSLYKGINKSMTNTGTDIGVPTGTKVALPPGEWEVVESYSGGGANSGYGNSILVKDKKTGEKLRFSHLSKVARLKKGDSVRGGKIVALSGATGNVTGPHLDLEYYDDKGAV